MGQYGTVWTADLSIACVNGGGRVIAQNHPVKIRTQVRYKGQTPAAVIEWMAMGVAGGSFIYPRQSGNPNITHDEKVSLQKLYKLLFR
jgi:hypothetical protein